MPVATQSQMDFLRSIDTPTVCNLVEIVAPERRGAGYTVAHLHCPFPDLAPMVGFAKTVTMRARDKVSGPSYMAKRMDYLDYVAAAPQPGIAVIEDLDDPAEHAEAGVVVREHLSRREQLWHRAEGRDVLLDAVVTRAGVGEDVAVDAAGVAQQVPDRDLPAGVLDAEPDAGRVPARVGEFGPLTFQNDDVLLDRLGAERVAQIKLLSGGSSRLFRVQDRGALYAYEIVNFVDGKRTIGEIRDAVSAEYGPIPLDVVTDYLKACEEAKVIAIH